MPTIQHSTLTGAELHEPKGADAAANYQVYVADGAGSGGFELLNPYGGIIYNDIAGSGTLYTTPTAYSICNVPTTATNLKNFTTNNLGRLTFTGTTTRHSHAVVDLSFKHSAGGGNDVTFGVHKNGSLLGSYEAISTADSTTFMRMVLHFDDMLATNDYYELYLKTPSGNVTVYGMYFFMMGMPG